MTMSVVDMESMDRGVIAGRDTIIMLLLSVVGRRRRRLSLGMHLSGLMRMLLLLMKP